MIIINYLFYHLNYSSTIPISHCNYILEPINNVKLKLAFRYLNSIIL